MSNTLHGVGDLIAYVPYEFGFAPADSFVLVGLRDGRLVVTARIDRPPPCDAAGAARDVLRGFGRRRPHEVLLLVYADPDPDTTAAATLVRTALARAGVPVSHLLLVRNDRWRAVECGCGRCPLRFTPVPDVDRVGPVAEQVARGVRPAPRRSDVEQRLDCRHPLVAQTVRRRLLDPRNSLGDPWEALAAVLLGELPVPRLEPRTLAAATAAVADVLVRDQVLSWLMPDFWPSDEGWPTALGDPPCRSPIGDSFDDPAIRLAFRLQEWVACLAPEHSVPVLMLNAGVQWSLGSGMLAMVAVERALRIEPDCRLATLLGAAVRSGLRPVPEVDRPA